MVNYQKQKEKNGKMCRLWGRTTWVTYVCMYVGIILNKPAQCRPEYNNSVGWFTLCHQHNKNTTQIVCTVGHNTHVTTTQLPMHLPMCIFTLSCHLNFQLQINIRHNIRSNKCNFLANYLALSSYFFNFILCNRNSQHWYLINIRKSESN